MNKTYKLTVNGLRVNYEKTITTVDLQQVDVDPDKDIPLYLSIDVPFEESPQLGDRVTLTLELDVQHKLG